MSAIISERLIAISQQRRPMYKIFLSSIENRLGVLFFKRSPPKPIQGYNLLHLGCGTNFLDGWVNADLYRFSDVLRRKARLPDWMLDATQIWKCPANYWDGIFTEHTLEHMDYVGVLNTLREANRTLKKGSWIRIVLPGLQAVMKHSAFNFHAEAVGYLSQTHGHLSVWDSDLMEALLYEVGFENVKVTDFGEGNDYRLINDMPARQGESFYIEAQK